MHQYDQAGVLVYASPDCWVKASLEYELDGPSKLGAVVTNHGYSDWSFQDFRAERKAVRVQIRKTGQDIEVLFADPASEDWSLVRVAHLACDVNVPLDGGLYACSPKDAGFRAEFSLFRIDLLEPRTP